LKEYQASSGLEQRIGHMYPL